MSYGRVDIDLRGLDFAIRSAVRAGADLRPVWRGFRKPLRKSQADHIKAQKGPDGTPWPKLRPSTVRARLSRGGSAKNYTKRGKLRKSAKRKAGKMLSRKLVSRARVKATRRSISFFAKGGVAHFHQRGGRAGRGGRSRVAARPFAYVDDELAQKATQAVAEHVARSFEEAKVRR